MSEKRPIGVVGVGWVGLVTASCFAEVGHPVLALDVDEGKIERLRRGESPIHEPRISELLQVNARRLAFTTEMPELLESAQLLFCCVDTPPTYSGDADLSRVRAVVAALPDEDHHVLVMKSTVPSGTGRAIGRSHPGLPYVSCPEFLREGSAVTDFLNPDRVVIGADPGDEWAADMVQEVYEPLGGELVRTDVASAEMVKLASNAFLATKISFINEIANVCEEVGADVTEVARGMGLDRRIGPSFLRAGLGFGGSCFAPGETVLVRHRGWPRLISFEELWKQAGGDAVAEAGEAIAPEDLAVWSWVPGEAEPEWMPVSVLTKRHYEGEIVEIRTKLDRRVRVTADHPVLVGDGEDERILTRVLASQLTDSDWLPLAGGPIEGFSPSVYPLAGAIEDGDFAPDQVIVRPMFEEIARLSEAPRSEQAIALEHPRGPSARLADIRRSGALRLGELGRAGLSARGASAKTARNGTYIPFDLPFDEGFWRLVGLYLAEGSVTCDATRRERIVWHFHPRDEEHLVEEVHSYWESRGVKASVTSTTTARKVSVSSRLLAQWWTSTLGLGRNAYEQRIPDLAWEQDGDRKRSLLSGLWEGDGSWSLVNGGPSVVLEWGTISDELAEGVVRLLAEQGIACSWRRGRTRSSTKEPHWLRVSGATQIERSLFLVPVRHRGQVLDLLAHQSKRTAPTGCRRFGEGPSWVRVTSTESKPYSGPVYSLKVPGSQTVVGSGGLVVSQCFPKDTQALKMLAGNTGYHFQLLTAVIEVNELQKRRVVAKLAKHLDSIAGRRIALLGLAFKPDTDDMREASSLVLAARLAGEGAEVVAYDPVASETARALLPEVELASSAIDALRGADAAVLVTEWAEFEELDWGLAAREMATPLLVDGRNFLEPESVRAAGLVYEGIGRPERRPGGDRAGAPAARGGGAGE